MAPGAPPPRRRRASARSPSHGGNRLAVKLRLTRVGSKKNPVYRIVAADSRSPRDGKFIEIVGRYNPQTDPSTIEYLARRPQMQNGPARSSKSKRKKKKKSRSRR